MFTGLVEEVGTIRQAITAGEMQRITIAAENTPGQLKKGDSVAVSGVCLTAVDVGKDFFQADLAAETLARTSFSRLANGALVNLELPMRADARFGGHIVQGHVDGVGTFLGMKQIPGGDDYWLEIEIPREVAKYVVFKGSLSLEGISLTVAKIEGTRVTIAIIPHTWKMTNLRSLKPGDPVNLEADVVAKYVEKMLFGDKPADRPLTMEALVAKGF